MANGMAPRPRERGTVPAWHQIPNPNLRYRSRRVVGYQEGLSVDLSRRHRRPHCVAIDPGTRIVALRPRKQRYSHEQVGEA